MKSIIDAIIVTSNNAGAESAQVYDGATGTHLKSYRGGVAAQSTLCAVGNAEYLVTAVRDKPFLQAWAVSRHEALQIRLNIPGRANAMAISPNGTKYCIVGIGEKIHMYKMLSGRLIGVSSRHYQPVTCLTFTSCGSYFASGGEDGFVYLWSVAAFIDSLHKHDVPQVQPHFILGQHSDKVTGLAMTASSVHGMLVSSSLDHTAKVFDLVTGRLVYSVICGAGITSVAINTLGSQLFVGTTDGAITAVNLLPHPPPGDIQADNRVSGCHEKEVRCLALTSTGNQVVSGGEDGEVKLWSVVAGGMGSHDSTGKHSITLALQRIVHTGRGRVMNLAILHTEKEVFSDAERELREIITPFSQDFSNPLTAEVKATIRGCDKYQHHFNLSIYGTEPSVVMREREDIEGTVACLQNNNKKLYSFAMEQVLEVEAKKPNKKKKKGKK